MSDPWSGQSESASFIQATENGFDLYQEFGSAPASLKLNDSVSLDTLRQQKDIYAIAPQDKVLNLAISSDIRSGDLSKLDDLNETFGSSLPFNKEELHYVIDQQEMQLFAIPRTDVETTLENLNDLGIVLKGIAFEGSNSFQTLSLETQTLTGLNGAAQTVPTMLKAISLLALLLLLLALASSILWRAQSQEQSALKAQILAIENENISRGLIMIDQPQITELKQSVAQISATSRLDVRRILRALVDALPTDVKINQLILNDSELVIDGEAISATAVQTVLEPLTVFSSSDFISSISSNTDNQLERFRLRLILQAKEDE